MKFDDWNFCLCHFDASFLQLYRVLFNSRNKKKSKKSFSGNFGTYKNQVKNITMQVTLIRCWKQSLYLFIKK